MRRFQGTGRGLWVLAVLVFTGLLLFSGPVLAVSEQGHGAGEEAAAEEGGHDGGHGEGSAGWRKTDTYRVLNFLVLAGALVFVARKPAKAALSGRIEDIKKELSDLEEKKAQTEAEIQLAEKRLASMDEEAKKILEDYEKQGLAAKERILAEAEKAAERLKEQAARHLENEFKEARRALKEEIVNRAVALSEERIKSSISSEDQGRLVNEYLEKVVAS
ncbi:MAG: ATP synthase F0 subunit B [Deltaproteobacteria bacterium]|nr:ATP synthase F0 subunit B [Deltaproteobacteria bacterium]